MKNVSAQHPTVSGMKQQKFVPTEECCGPSFLQKKKHTNNQLSKTFCCLPASVMTTFPPRNPAMEMSDAAQSASEAAQGDPQHSTKHHRFLLKVACSRNTLCLNACRPHPHGLWLQTDTLTLFTAAWLVEMCRQRVVRGVNTWPSPEPFSAPDNKPLQDKLQILDFMNRLCTNSNKRTKIQKLVKTEACKRIIH